MDRAIRTAVLAALVAAQMVGVLATTAVVQARQDEAGQGGQDDQDVQVDRALDELRDEVDRLRDDNESMRSEIDELRALATDDWLTEKRADEIRGLVEEVLVDAESRASLLGSGMTAGWDDGFFLASADGKFRLNLSGQLQVRWIFNYHDTQVDKYLNGWEVTRAVLTFDGHVFTPDLSYLVRIDPTRDEPMLVTGLHFLKDAWVRYEVNNEWSVRVGQFKLPFNREELVSSAYQLAVERSLVSERLGIERSQGVELAYTGDYAKFTIATSDGGTDNLGGFNAFVTTQPINTPALLPTVEFSVTGRYEALIAGNWKQFEDFTSPPGEEFGMLLGVAGHYQKNDNDGAPSLDRNESEWYAWTVDASMEWGGASAFASFTHHYVESAVGGGTNVNMLGAVVQGSVYLSNKVEVYGRWQYGWWDEFDFSDLNTVTIGLNYYIDGHDVKWTSDIGFGISQIESNWIDPGPNGYRELTGWRVDPEEAEPQIVFRTQLQLLF